MSYRPLSLTPSFMQNETFSCYLSFVGLISSLWGTKPKRIEEKFFLPYTDHSTMPSSNWPILNHVTTSIYSLDSKSKVDPKCCRAIWIHYSSKFTGVWALCGQGFLFCSLVYFKSLEWCLAHSMYSECYGQAFHTFFSFQRPQTLSLQFTFGCWPCYLFYWENRLIWGEYPCPPTTKATTPLASFLTFASSHLSQRTVFPRSKLQLTPPIVHCIPSSFCLLETLLLLRKFYKGKKCKPLDLGPKKRGPMCRWLNKHEKNPKTKKQRQMGRQ